MNANSNFLIPTALTGLSQLSVQEHGLDHLHIPTVDFLFAPPTEDLHRGAGFIYGNPSESLSCCLWG